MYPPREAVTKVVKSKWFVIAVGIWIQSCTGASYDFSIYSQSIKTNLGYNQEELDAISFSKDVGANVGIISGLLYNVLPPWTILAIAAALSFIGYFMVWLSMTNKIATPALWQMCLYTLIAANAQTFSNTAVIVTCVKIFPTSRGTVVGLMKGFLGVSGAVLVQLYNAVYANDEEAFPLLMAWLIPVVCLTFMFVIRPLQAVEDGYEKKWLNMLSVIALVLAAYLLGVILLEDSVALERLWKIVIFAVILILLLLPAWVAVKAELKSEESGLHSAETDALLCETSEIKGLTGSKLTQNSSVVMDSPRAVINAGQTSQHDKALENIQGLKPERGDNFTLLQAALAADFWLLFFATACGMGSGLTTINNMSQLGSSLGYAEREVDTFVSLWSIWNFLGRFGGGYISEFYLHSKGIARPLFIAITLAAMGVGHIMIAAAFPGALYIGPILVGVCYGAQWSLMPSTASELFGLQNFGALFNTIAIASPLGSYILSVKVAGYLYDLEAEKGISGRHISHSRSLWLSSVISESLSCSGSHCFRLTFIIMAAVCLAGFTISSVLFLRTRTFYKVQGSRIRNSGHL